MTDDVRPLAPAMDSATGCQKADVVTTRGGEAAVEGHEQPTVVARQTP